MDRMISGIKPSGQLTLGNYIGAIRNFINYQNDYELYVFIANLHAITVPQEKGDLKRNIREMAALYLACGLDPNKTTLFIQSDVLEHANLAFILNCYGYMGELSRMTQYKEKIGKSKDNNITVGLFTYPLLMASDILLYDAQFVPVGDDQKQHVELTRDVAIRFNNLYGDVFIIPKPVVSEIGARIMSLSNPSKKMSKSDDIGDKGCIYLLDDLKIVRKKIMSAVTDSDSKVLFDPINKPGISNLIQIYCSLANISFKECEEKFVNQNYGTFKTSLADLVCEKLGEIQTRYYTFLKGDQLEQIFKDGASKARLLAHRKLLKVENKIGLNI